jgi:hypothetical protein
MAAQAPRNEAVGQTTKDDGLSYLSWIVDGRLR